MTGDLGDDIEKLADFNGKTATRGTTSVSCPAVSRSHMQHHVLVCLWCMFIRTAQHVNKSFSVWLVVLSTASYRLRVYSVPQGEVRCEPPNNRLDRFTGTLTYAGQKYSLDNEKILLRGCTLRNTDWCFGLVLFGGREEVSHARVTVNLLSWKRSYVYQQVGEM